jgi:anti-sigma B factor antagonist
VRVTVRPGQAVCPSCLRRRKQVVVSDETSSRSPDRTVIASVAGVGETLTAVIYHCVEPFVPEADMHVVVIAVEGDLDSDTAAYLEPAVRQAIGAGGLVCCDFRRVGYFGAAGARVVMSAVEDAAECGTLFLVRGMQGMAWRVLEAVGFEWALVID